MSLGSQAILLSCYWCLYESRQSPCCWAFISLAQFSGPDTCSSSTSHSPRCCICLQNGAWGLCSRVHGLCKNSLEEINEGCARFLVCDLVSVLFCSAPWFSPGSRIMLRCSPNCTCHVAWQSGPFMSNGDSLLMSARCVFTQHTPWGGELCPVEMGDRACDVS